ncbi:nucleoside phosphorylase [Bradyrhizobium sp. USDA 4461]
MALDQPIYLHFLDRELWESLRLKPDRDVIARSLRVLLLGCDEPLYCGLSLLWENPALRDSSSSITKFVLKLVECGAIEAVSQHPTVEEFIETRRELYNHDRSRYPLYYTIKRPAGWGGPKATRVKTSSATNYLAGRIDDWARGGTEQMLSGREAPSKLRRAVRKAITERDDRAITFALFRSYLGSAGIDGVTAEFEVRRQISRGYTAHYMTYASGGIATGIGPLSYFDSLSKAFPDHDVGVLEFLLSLSGMSQAVAEPFELNELKWLHLAARRHEDLLFHQVCRNLRVISRTMHFFARDELKAAQSNDSDLFGLRTAVMLSMRRFLSGDVGSKIATDDYIHTLFVGSNLLLRSVENCRELRRAYEMAMETIGKGAPRLLIATATAIERDAVLQMAKQYTGADPILIFGSRRSYYRLGGVGGVDLFLVQSEMGSLSPGASHSTIADALDELHPVGVIMVGIAFGVNEKRQSIGEIIIAKELQSYEMARVGTGARGRKVTLTRGYRVHSSSSMLSRLRAAEVGWTGKKVRVGLLLTGEKLVDNVDFRQEILSVSPEADGGEMEGGGLYAAAADRKVDWIVVKAICDWADGNKSKNKKQRQELAASEAVGFVLRAIQQGGFQNLNISSKHL